jgi:hypothetical protein
LQRKAENDKLPWSNLGSVAQERLRVLTRAASSLNVSREKKGDIQGASGKERKISRQELLAETSYCLTHAKDDHQHTAMGNL